MTNEEFGWALVVFSYYFAVYVVPSVVMAGLCWFCYWLGKRHQSLK